MTLLISSSFQIWLNYNSKVEIKSLKCAIIPKTGRRYTDLINSIFLFFENQFKRLYPIYIYGVIHRFWERK